MLPPVVTGAVVMLIGFNLAPVVASIYWPQDQWVALLVMAFTIIWRSRFKGFVGRIAVFLALIFGYVMSWLFDKIFGPDHRPTTRGAGKVTTHDRIELRQRQGRRLVRLPAARRRPRRRQGDRRLARPVASRVDRRSCSCSRPSSP